LRSGADNENIEPSRPVSLSRPDPLEAKIKLEVTWGSSSVYSPGVIAKALLPGDDPGGFIITTLIGIAGAFIGGLIVKALGDGDPIDEFFDSGHG
jgi:hypothetical protein